MPENRSKLVNMTVRNIGCIGPEGITVALDDVVCIVGRNNSGKSTILRAYELAQGAEAFDWSKDRYANAEENDPSEILLGPVDIQDSHLAKFLIQTSKMEV